VLLVVSGFEKGKGQKDRLALEI